MGFGSDRIKKQAFKMKVDNKLEMEFFKERKLALELDLIEVEIRKLQTRKREIELKLESEIEKNRRLHEKTLRYEGKLLDICPMCYLEHKASPPDECWIKANKSDDGKQKLFDRYLRKHSWGSM